MSFKCVDHSSSWSKCPDSSDGGLTTKVGTTTWSRDEVERRGETTGWRRAKKEHEQLRERLTEGGRIEMTTELLIVQLTEKEKLKTPKTVTTEGL